MTTLMMLPNQKSFKNAKTFASSVYQYYNQYKLIHRRMVNNQLLKKMNISNSEVCLFCNELPETIEHMYMYLYCTHANKLWNDTVSCVRNTCIYDHHFMISDHEKRFGYSTDNQVTPV